MANSQIDRLSALPDELLINVLSLLLTCKAASTSVLSRRYRHLWKASPSVDLSIESGTYFNNSTYVAMANSALLSRTPSNPLLSLHLEFDLRLPCDISPSFICSLLVYAHALGLRHLTIDGHWKFEHVLQSVFSISSLESLSICITPPKTCPSAIALNCLKSLSINWTRYNSTTVKQLISELCCLEHLQLSMFSGNVCLSSPTIKKLELLLFGNIWEPDSLGLSMPSLECLCLKNIGVLQKVLRIHGEIPFLRKVVVALYGLHQKHITVVAQFLNFISHVEELSIDLDEHMLRDYPFTLFLEPGKEVPTFPNLKHLDVNTCFHERNFEAVVTMLHRCTALESLNLHHKNAVMWEVEMGKRNAWRSKLPRNGDGNYQYAYFKNLHLGENRKEFEKLLNKKPKRQRVEVAMKKEQKKILEFCLE